MLAEVHFECGLLSMNISHLCFYKEKSEYE